MTGNETSPSASGKRLVQAVTLAALGALCFTAAGCPPQTGEQETPERHLTLQLPQDDAPRPLSETPRDLIISIAADGTTTVAGKVYSREELADMLSRIAAEQPERDVLMRADGSTLWKHVVDVFNLLHRAGINQARIGFLIRDDQPQPGE